MSGMNYLEKLLDGVEVEWNIAVQRIVDTYGEWNRLTF